MPSAQNYEEIKLNVPAGNREEVESQASTAHGGVEDEEQKAMAPAARPDVYMEAEDDFDAEFFGRKIPKIKLNKGEKRQLKFEMRAGVDLNEVGDLKTYLGGKMKQGKVTHNTPITAKGAPG